MKTSDVGHGYLRWWLGDLPPLHGALRLIFYLGLLLLAQTHHKSPLRAIELYAATEPEFVHARGLFQLLGFSYIAPGLLVRVMQVTFCAWVLAAFGLLTRLSAVVTALGVLFLHGVFVDTNAGNHAWYLPVYTLALLCFASSGDAWSVDYQCKKLWSGRVPQTPARLSVARTGFARKAVLVVTVGFYFAAGMSKLSASGVAWADGYTLNYFAAEGGLLRDNLWLCTLMSVGALFLEVGSIALLFSRRLRLPFLLLWTLMHLGIRYTVGPWYWSNIWVFLLLVDWGAVSGLGPEPARAPVEIGTRAGISYVRAVTAATAGSILLVVVLAVGLLRIEWWPFTNVDMYSSYYGRGLVAGHPRGTYNDPHLAQQIAKDCAAKGCPRLVGKHIAFQVELRLTRSDGQPLILEDGLGTPFAKQWFKSVVQPVIVADLAAKPEGSIDWDPTGPGYPGTRFLEQDVVPVVRRLVNGWREFERVELVYELDGMDAVIASVPLHDEDP